MDEYISVGQAAKQLGASRMRIWRMTRDGRLTVYESDLDKRTRLVKRADIARLMTPRPAPSRTPKEGTTR